MARNSSGVVSKEFSRTVERMLHPLKKEEQLTQQEKDLRDYIKLVLSIARPFVRTKVELEDLTMVGVMGLLEAREKYDPSRSDNFKAYAHMRIMGRIYSYCQKNTRLISIPTHIAKASSYVERIEKALNAIGPEVGLDAWDIRNILLNRAPEITKPVPSVIQDRIEYYKARIDSIALNSGLVYETLASLSYGALVQTVSDAVLNSHVVSEMSVELEASGKELRDKLEKSLGKKRFMVLELHSQGFTNPEISKILYEVSQTDPDIKTYDRQISRSAVKNILDNAKEAVRKMRCFKGYKKDK